MKKILIVTYKEPITSSMPGNPRLHEIMTFLSADYQLHLVIINHKNAELNLNDSVYDIFNSVVVFDYAYRKENFMYKIYRYAAMLPGDKPGVGSFNQVSVIKRKIDALQNKLSPDFVYVDGIVSTYFMSAALLKMSYVDLCDSVSKLKLREATKSKKILRRLALCFESLSVYLNEIFVCIRAKSVSFISAEETTAYKAIFERKIKILPQGVSSQEFYYKPLDSSSLEMLFFGALDYVPNNDAALWFTKEIFPQIQHDFGNAKLKVVGKSPPQEVLDLGSEMVSIIPNVRSMIEYIHNSFCVIVPLRIGAGVKNKILVAALAGRPIIASSLALEGMPEEIIASVHRADTAEQYIEVLRELSDTEIDVLNEKLFKLSNFVKSRYSWENSSKILIKSIEEIE